MHGVNASDGSLQTPFYNPQGTDSTGSARAQHIAKHLHKALPCEKQLDAAAFASLDAYEHPTTTTTI